MLFIVFYGFNQTQKQLIKIGDKIYNEGDYYGASIWYKKALNIDSTYLDLVYKYAESLRMYNDYKKAESKYYYVYKKDRGKLYPYAPFWYATMLKHNEKYKDAKTFFKRSKRYYTQDRKGYYYQKVIQEINSCEFAYKKMKDSVNVDIYNLGEGVNTYNSEFGSALTSDSILFYASLRDEKMKENNIVSDTSAYLVRLFKAIKQNGKWNTIEKLPEKINEIGYHVANGSFSNDGKTFYFTKCKGYNGCKIYRTSYENGSWGNVEEVKELNIDGYTTTQPSLAEINGKEYIFFASNRNGTLGGLDIWYAKYQDNKFTTPQNVGELINSIDDEVTPFYNSSDSTLYFSSKWHYGFGGFDIFKSKGLPEKLEKPKNVGVPINSAANDFYFSFFDKVAMLSSNRAGSYTKKGETCCNDIYAFDITYVPVYTSLEELNRYLPVTLYFHNDEPNPRTRDTVTNLNYLTCYESYLKLYPTYKKEYSAGLTGEDKEDAITDIESFFEDYVKKGVEDLKMFTPLLLKELEKGKSITLTIKGYASPLSKTDYNVNLTLRRVSSLINYLKEYDNGVLLPYINGTAENGGKLRFIKVPFGEYTAQKFISDNINDKKNSIYSRAASLERKIEIIAVAEDDTTHKALDGSEIEKTPEITVLEDDPNDFKIGPAFHNIPIKNTGENDLIVYEIKSSNPGIKVNFELEKPIKPNEEKNIELIIDESVKAGTYSLEIISNCIPSQMKITFYIRVAY
ncbi:MAG: hypothetical protein Kow0079_11230 [Vicingaceae bacterium]